MTPKQIAKICLKKKNNNSHKCNSNNNNNNHNNNSGSSILSLRACFAVPERKEANIGLSSKVQRLIFTEPRDLVREQPDDLPPIHVFVLQFPLRPLLTVRLSMQLLFPLQSAWHNVRWAIATGTVKIVIILNKRYRQKHPGQPTEQHSTARNSSILTLTCLTKFCISKSALLSSTLQAPSVAIVSSNVSAPVKLIPTPPERVESIKQNIRLSLLNRSIRICRCSTLCPIIGETSHSRTTIAITSRMPSRTESSSEQLSSISDGSVLNSALLYIERRVLVLDFTCRTKAETKAVSSFIDFAALIYNFASPLLLLTVEDFAVSPIFCILAGVGPISSVLVLLLLLLDT
ncbi:hypothetical protein GQX74_010641 [Glossina fuscipes]|nr:hypothetical protein GQX74_010641 [Glossina fuscipes]